MSNAHPHEHPVISCRPEIASALFSVNNLYYHYSNGISALFDIDLHISKGDRIALVGPNGSGKTTLARLLCGLLAPTTGTISYKGAILDRNHLEQSRLEIGLLFQDPDDQLFGHTLLDDVAFGPRRQGRNRAEAAAVALESLVQVGLDETAYKEPHHLSFGQKKRAAFAGLLAMKPEVLILDEPTANLDPRQEEIFLNLLRAFSGTLICISHDLLFLYELCSRAIVLDGGRIYHDTPMDALVAHRQSLRDHGLDFSFRLETADLTPTESNVFTSFPFHTQESLPVTPLITFSDYQYRYPDCTQALSEVTLDIHAGERIAIVGENGAGKTTLLSCLMGSIQGLGGFQFEGQSVTRRVQKRLWREVGMVFQDCADQLFCAGVGEEVAFGPTQLRLPTGEIQNRVCSALKTVRLSGFEDRVPLHLSGGERKRLALACVLAMKPKLLILDEPTAGLDPAGQELLLSVLGNLDTTILLVSHDMLFIRELTRRTIVMHGGNIIGDFPTSVFLTDNRMGKLNGLAVSYRHSAGSAIRALQHRHAPS